jgi:hypothetical protein
MTQGPLYSLQAIVNMAVKLSVDREESAVWSVVDRECRGWLKVQAMDIMDDDTSKGANKVMTSRNMGTFIVLRYMHQYHYDQNA